MNFVLLSFYRYMLMPLTVVSLPLLAIVNSKVRKGLKLRQIFPAQKPENKPLWIHAASGEFEYAKAVIRELKLRQPDIPVLVTYFSPTYAEAAARFAGVDAAQALPLDLPGPCRSFLQHVNPRALLIARTDLWPEMLTQCRARKVPVILFSYTQKPFRNRLQTWITRWRLSLVDQIFSVTADDQSALTRLKLKVPIQTLGDTRYDQVEFRLRNGQSLPLKKPEGRLCFIAGSTWDEDELVLLAGLKEFLVDKKLQLILVPHEPTPEHLSKLEKRIALSGLSSQRSSRCGAWFTTEILIVDRVGILAELYQLADLAFVGGSFRKSVHSVMEALGTGTLTFVGPFHENNREAVEFKHLTLGPYQGIEIINDSEDLTLKVQAVLQRPNDLNVFREKLLAEFRRRLGASRKLIDALEKLVHGIK